ncbi:MAG: hypothetical protein BMS9Abin05_1834 [Rhodothermia bacterium]|nr:MAG: hypothetical protein BMS9Abin05_1834 [Rhodothermia bacterium]
MDLSHPVNEICLEPAVGTVYIGDVEYTLIPQ